MSIVIRFQVNWLTKVGLQQVCYVRRLGWVQ